jgi:DNA-binding NarL/FixJ family response regulator
VLEGHGALRRRLVLALEEDDDLQVVAEATHADALAEVCADLQPQCVVISVGDVPSAVTAVRAGCPTAVVVLVVTSNDADAAVAGLRAGARGFVNREALAQAAAVVRAVAAGVIALPPLLAGALLGPAPADRGPAPALTGDEQAVLRQLAAGRSYGAAAEAVGIAEERARSLVAGVVDRFQEAASSVDRAP